MLVVPAEEQKDGVDVAHRFFELTYGTLSADSQKYGPQILYAFMAISALGNIIVMTYTAARVKQEIAKEGILPFRKFFSRSRSIRGIPLDWLLCRRSRHYREEIPVGALVLHWAVSVLLILATATLLPTTAYNVLVSLYSYTIDAFFGVVLALGIFYLRIKRSRHWSENNFLANWVSMLAAFIYGVSMAFPVVTSWVPPSVEFWQHQNQFYPWFTTPAVSCGVVGLGVIYWVGFYYIWPLRDRERQLLIRRKMFINEDGIMYHEQFKFKRPLKEHIYDANVVEEVVAKLGSMDEE